MKPAKSSFGKLTRDLKNEILKSAEDQAIFFDTIANPPKPGDDLILAAKRYVEVQKKTRRFNDSNR